MPHRADLNAVFELPDEKATQDLACRLAPLLRPGTVVHLVGDLGAGKTTLVRGVLRALGHAGAVKSPTYSLVEVYVISSLYFYHFDFYRFESPEEFLDAGLAEYFNDASVCLVEWPEKAQDYAPAADLRCRFEHAGNGRRVEIAALSPAGEPCVSALKQISTGGGSSTSQAPR